MQKSVRQLQCVLDELADLAKSALWPNDRTPEALPSNVEEALILVVSRAACLAELSLPPAGKRRKKDRKSAAKWPKDGLRYATMT